MEEADAAKDLIRHAAFVRRLAVSLAGDAAEADDLEQEAWLAALKRPPSRSPRAWFRRVLGNLRARTARGAVRRRARERLVARPEGVEPSPGRERLLVAVAEAVEALAEPFRTAVIERFYEGLPPRESAARHGVPVDTVRSRVRRGVERLRADLDARHDGDRRRWLLPLLALAGRDRRPPAAPAGAALVTGGLLAMKTKLLLAAAALLLLAAAAVLFGPTSVRPAAPSPAPSAARAAADDEASTEGAGSRDPAGPGAKGGVDPAREGPSLEVYSAADGSPVAGVEIVFEEGAGPSGLRTDEAGRVELPLLSTATVATLRKEGFRPGTAAVTRRPEARRVTLEPGLPVAGRVLLAGTDERVADAVVEVTSEEEHGWRITLPPTGEDGSFRIPGVRPGAPFAVTVRKDGYGLACLRTRRVAAGLPVVLRIGGGAELSGTVRRPDGTPAAGAEVFLFRAGSDPYDWRRERKMEILSEPKPEDGACSVADAEGRYVFRGVEVPGTWSIHARTPAAEAASGRPVRLAAGTTTATRDVALVALPVTRVRVVDEEGRPIDDARVSFSGPGSTISGGLLGAGAPSLMDLPLFPREASGPVGTPDRPAPGVYRLVGDRPGKRRVYVAAPGRVARVVTTGPTAADAAPTEVVLAPAGFLTGRVLDEDGTPVAGAEVQVAAGDPNQRATGYAGGDGRFRVDGVPPRTVSVTAIARDLGWARVDGVTPGEEPVEIRVPRPARLRGRLVPPCPGRGRLVLRSPRGSALLFLEVGADGRFEETLAAGRVDGSGTTEAVIAPVGGTPILRPDLAIRPGEVLDLGEIPVEPGQALTGVVTNDEGARIAGARVDFTPEPPFRPSTTWTDGDGAFRFEDVPDAPARVRISDAGMFLPTERRVEHAARAAALAITLEEGGKVELRLTDREGLPVVGARVFGRPLPGESGPVFGATGDSGGVHRAVVPPGRYRLFLRPPGHRGDPIPGPIVTVVAGGTADVDFRPE